MSLTLSCSHVSDTHSTSHKESNLPLSKSSRSCSLLTKLLALKCNSLLNSGYYCPSREFLCCDESVVWVELDNDAVNIWWALLAVLEFYWLDEETKTPGTLGIKDLFELFIKGEMSKRFCKWRANTAAPKWFEWSWFSPESWSLHQNDGQRLANWMWEKSHIPFMHKFMAPASLYPFWDLNLFGIIPLNTTLMFLDNNISIIGFQLGDHLTTFLLK